MVFNLSNQIRDGNMRRLAITAAAFERALNYAPSTTTHGRRRSAPGRILRYRSRPEGANRIRI